MAKQALAVPVAVYLLGLAGLATASSTLSPAGFGRVVLYTFALALAEFHTSEFLLAAHFHPRTLVSSSWLVSAGYAASMLLAFVETSIGLLLVPAWKTMPSLVLLGWTGLVLGETFRKGGIISAGQSFSHLIAWAHHDHHRLITSGFYSYVRHPGYFGFYLWACSTQLMLGNPVSFAVFAVVLWKFFSARIRAEESTLVSYFGQQYLEYRARVPTRIPGIP